MSQILEALASSVRAHIAAPPGRTLVVCDLSSIEVWVLGWLADCEGINRLAREGKDPYKGFAEDWLGIPYDRVDKATRTLCKPPMLGCGYRLGAGEQDPDDPEHFTGLMAYGRSMGIELSQEQATSGTQAYRKKYWEVVEFWRWCEQACYQALQGETVTGHHLTFQKEKDFLTIELPSGRKLFYHRPMWRKIRAPWAKKNIQRWINEGDIPEGFLTLAKQRRWTEIDANLQSIGLEDRIEGLHTFNLSYMGKNQKTNQWVRMYTHGGKVTENLVQALARDVMVHGMMDFESTWCVKREPFYNDEILIIGHVHDEIMVEAPESEGNLVLGSLAQSMSKTPPWAPGLILGAEGYVSKRYRKG